MNKRFILTVIICCILLSQTVKAQDPITTLQHAGKTQVFYGTTSFSDAYTASAKGDTLYLSVGGFTPPAAIAKTLTVIGSGHFPDSVAVKRRSTILGGLTINAGADSLHLEGLYINGDINYQGDASINFVNVSRCKLLNCNFNSNSESNGKNNCSFIECFIEGNVSFNNYGNNLILKHNIIQKSVYNIIANATIDGNIFLITGFIQVTFSAVSSSVIRNNIFLFNYPEDVHSGVFGASTYGKILCSNNIIDNNLFILSSVNFQTNSSGSNNYFGVPQADIFVNQTGNSIDYSHNYHLKNPEKYIGTDGTQVGLYGGVIPFKDGGAPSNPQITSKGVDTKTDTNGNLKINYTVKAQDN